jgi:hypothetical protein
MLVSALLGSQATRGRQHGATGQLHVGLLTQASIAHWQPGRTHPPALLPMPCYLSATSLPLPLPLPLTLLLPLPLPL